jgi:predicted DNA-binding ribbon-helix-helix protein
MAFLPYPPDKFYLVLRAICISGMKMQKAAMGNGNDADSSENRSTLVSRNITVRGRRTSVRLEPEMWNALREITRREECRINDICSLIHLRKKPHTSLTAAIRVFLMLYYRAAATEEGHAKAGHGDFDSMLHRARVTRALLEGSGMSPSVPSGERERDELAVDPLSPAGVGDKTHH